MITNKNKDVNMLLKKYDSINNQLYFWVIILSSAIVVVLIASGIHKNNLKIEYKTLLQQYTWEVNNLVQEYMMEVNNLNNEQTKAITDLRQLLNAIKPLADHKEVQLIDFYKQKLYEYELRRKKKNENANSRRTE